MTIQNYFDNNKFNSINDTGKTWEQIGAEFGMSGEAARKKMRRHWKSGHQNETTLKVKSQWQVLGKGGEIITLQSFKPAENGESLKAEDIDEVCQKYAQKSAKRLIRQNSGESHSGTQIIALGDVHIGMANEDNIFNLKWNKEELFKRADILIGQVDPGASDIWLIFGGDICDGQQGKTTRGLKGLSSHTLPQNLSDKGQIDLACEFITYILDGVVDATNADVGCTFISNSNHGGILDYAVGKVMEAACASRYDGQVNWELQTEFMFNYYCRPFGILVTHGYDEEHMNKGWSRFLSKDNEQLIERFINTNRLTTEVKSNILLRFDQHQSTDIRYNGFRDIVCPAFSNPSSWVSLNFGSDYKGGFMKIAVKETSISTELIEF